jgi:hypothetical protein
MRQRGVDLDAAKSSGSVRAVVENPFLLLLNCDCRTDVDILAIAQAAGRGAAAACGTCTIVHDAALSRWIRDAVRWSHGRRGAVITREAAADWWHRPSYRT